MLLVCLVSNVSVLANEDSDEQKPYVVKEFTLNGAGILKTFTTAGNIDVQSTYNTDKVRVELYVERGYAIWSGSRNLDNYRINILQRGNEIIASVEEKKRSGGLFSEKVNFNFRIYVPERMSTELKTLGGNIKLSRLTGDQMAKTSGGNIILHSLKGKIGAYTSGGNIEITSSRGTIFAQTEGGNISVDRTEGELRLRTAGGDIIAEHTTGSFIARADAGNIKGHFIDVGQGISMETSAGNIFAELPGNTGLTLSASGSHISFDQMEHFTGRKEQQLLEGKLNDGGIPISLQTSSGTITIKTN
ncbi:DUF4097 domain-containing protein [Aliifodinibius sp. S!AR15-10]|uniref:DUF4097 family beta strand repeat-containing protein n=1 Tax=Aliifodinibius sp. S!AR15-10 TaxID=2950437 RepID=UPI0028670B84|nr:DUF4097 family beta strand repeat-containing protein [Aliifodinibius sp. S!AR15-10]MDR8391023.1 DUF4097 domain-containing protein [Aliifodinibius sp. S!AR15-10]